jgi:hypothetical protein
MIVDPASYDNPTSAVELHLRTNAHRYFEELEPRAVDVRLVDRQIRPASRFYRYQVSAGNLHHSVLIKMPPAGPGKPRSGNQAQEGSDRPRMTSTADAAVKHLLEYNALVAIQSYFERLADGRFGAIKALNYLPDQSALLMEELRTPNLLTLFSKTNRLQHPLNSIDLQEAFCNAGAWLRHYHTLPKDSDVQVRHATRADFIDSIDGYTSYLGRMLRKEEFFRQVGASTIERAERVLPQELPLGLGHGDYAMRNILISNNSRVTVIDTLSRWRVPIYEDISYFLIRLKANRLQVYSLGHAIKPELAAQYEQRFLYGYFGGEQIPVEAVRLFEVQALLDNWAAHIAAYYRKAQRSSMSIGTKLRLGIINRFYGKLLSSYSER